MSPAVDPERARQIREAIAASLQRREREVREVLAAALRTAPDEALARLSEPLDLADENLAPSAVGAHLLDDLLLDLHTSVERLSGAADQTAILDRLTEGAVRFSARAAVFVVRQESAVGWKAAGFLPAPPGEVASIRAISVAINAAPALARAIASGTHREDTDPEAADGVWGAFDAAPSDAYAAFPVSVRGRVVAVLWADSGAGETRAPIRVGALATLTRVAEGTLEIIALRGRAQAPKVASGVERRPSESWEPAGPPIPPEPDRRGFTATPAATVLPDSPATAAQSPSPHAPPPDSGPGPHEEAQRFARLLVSEILLYNGPQAEEGRRQRDLYRRLREDLDRSEQMYRQRVAPEVLASSNYFHEELVRTLAGGDAALLGER